MTKKPELTYDSQKYMDDTLKELVGILKDKTAEIEHRLTAAKIVDGINDTFLKVQGMHYITDMHKDMVHSQEETADKVLKQVERLKPKKPEWMGDDEEE